jgi:hypothetical protein
MSQGKRDWRKLCKAITEEQDSGKLFELIQQLLAALDERKSSASSNKAEAAP